MNINRILYSNITPIIQLAVREMAEATEHAPRQDCIGRGHLTNLRRHCHVDIPNQMQLGTSMVHASLGTYNLRKVRVQLRLLPEVAYEVGEV